MKVDRTVQVTLNEKEIDTLEDMRVLLEDLYYAMEDAYLSEVTTIIDNGVRNWRSVQNKGEIEQMLNFVQSFY